MLLVIAEKSSVARAIAAIVPQGVRVTHCVGHLLEMAEPDAYDARWKSWSVDALPIKVSAWKLKPKPATARQLSIVGDLLKQATEVVHAGDPDREGQLLVDEVLDYFGWRGPTQRLLLTDLHPDGLRKSWKQLKDNREFQPMRQAAESRRRADWIVGMNMTRATTRLLGDGGLISIGRVQTPTLALVVRRHKAIAGFKEQTFFTLKADFSLSGGRNVELKCEPDPRILDERVAAGLAAAAKGQRTTVEVVEEQKSRRSPLPFNLGGFQKAAERHFGWSLDAALTALQAAYEGGWVSYPRSDCQHLPSDHKAGAVAIATKVAGALGVALTAGLAPKDRVYDSSKVEAHYGIVPTGDLPPAGADPQAVKAWTLVSLHYLRTLMPDERYKETRLKAVIQTAAAAPHASLVFSRKGETPDGQPHWQQLNLDTFLPPVRRKGGKAAVDAPLPPITNGEAAMCAECVRSKGKTTPPKPYTESSLRDDMENVAKYATDPKMQEILKETKGIGTAATQAGIVKTLFQRKYLVTGKAGTLDASPFGIAVIDAIPSQLADPVLTAAWEKALSLIAKGQYDPAGFVERVDALVVRHLGMLRQAKASGVVIKAPAPAKVARPAAKGSAKPQARSSGKPANPRSRAVEPRAKAKPSSGKGPDANGFI